MHPDLIALYERLGSTDNPLTDEELQQLHDGLLNQFDEVDGSEDGRDIALMRELVDADEKVKSEQTARAEAAAAAEAEAEELRQRMKPADETDPADPPAGDPPAGEAGDPPPAGDAPAGDTPPVPVAAGGAPTPRPPLGTLANRVPVRSRPVPKELALARAVMRVASPRAGFQAGQELNDMEQLGRLGAEALRAAHTDTIIASMDTSYPKDRTLSRDDAYENEKKINAVAEPTAIVAAGGVCLPVNVDYSIRTIGDTDRPVRDSLASFNADRGGIQFVPQPTLVGGSWGNAFALWTEANDVSPSSPATKPIFTVACAAPIIVYVDAIPVRVKIGNFMGRFSPEQVASNIALVNVAVARFAELNLLSKINAQCTELTTAKLLGTVRDLLANLDLAIAQYRGRHRLNRSTRLRAILPEFAKDMMRADMVRQLATDSNGNDMAISDAQVDAWFAVRNVNITWHMDPIAAQTAVTGPPIVNAFPKQGWDTALVAGAAIQDWPASVVWNLFAEGDFVFLDGGRLDLGVVRDSTLNNTNDYQIFMETFEGVAFRGVEALRIISTVRPNGASAGTVSTASY